jgi:ribosomal protein S21
MMGVRIVVGEGEPIGLAIKRFKKKLEINGVRGEVNRHLSFRDRTGTRRAKQFKKRFKARKATLIAKQHGLQPSDSPEETIKRFWKRTGKP